MKIISTKPGDTNFQLVELIPKSLYAPDSIRHRQAESINMEFLDNFYVLLDNNEPQASLAIYNNPQLNYKGKKSVCIGNYECVNNIKISKEIINYAINEAKRKGAEFLIGPMNGSTWDNYRFSLKLDHPNFLLEPYHHIYYNDHFLNSGFMPISKYRSSINHVMPVDSEDVLKLEDKFYDSGVNIRNIEIRNYENELKNSTLLYHLHSKAIFYIPQSAGKHSAANTKKLPK
ncbi:MAG: hypothetical protein IPI30_04590 [Saprospiraceae bacterium]|nr:hypothetical protein [Candidatus Vicinibacter affinis]